MATIEMPMRIIGIEASPYSVKLRAFCRYRRIPYLWVSRMPQYFPETASLSPVLMPVVQYPDGQYAIDSTPIIHTLDSQCDPARSIYPTDPALRFLSLLIEDFADEWLTKCLFYYRFTYPADRAYGPRWVMDDTHPQATLEELDERHHAFLARQTERMPLVGCVPEHAELLEQSYHHVLEILEPFVALEKFLFGTRPSLADFGLFGQLKTLATDPTPREVMRAKAPRVDTWTMRLDDTSGVEGEFLALDDLDPVVEKLIKLICEVYLSYLEANNSAHHANAKNFSTTLDGHKYTQATFKYQVKCLQHLREKYAGLPTTAKEKLMPFLNQASAKILSA
jgi:glutathione S-transferase